MNKSNLSYRKISIGVLVVSSCLASGAVYAASFCNFLAGAVVENFNFDGDRLTAGIGLEMDPDSTRVGAAGMRVVQLELIFDFAGSTRKASIPVLAVYPSKPATQGSCEISVSAEKLSELGVNLSESSIDDVRIGLATCEPEKMTALMKSSAYVRCR